MIPEDKRTKIGLSEYFVWTTNDPHTNAYALDA